MTDWIKPWSECYGTDSLVTYHVIYYTRCYMGIIGKSKGID